MKKILLTLVVSLSLSVVSFAQTTIETLKMSGIEMVESLNDDGTDLVKYPYKWYLGIADSDNKSLAVEMATREAYATISRIIENKVLDASEKVALAVDNKVHSAVLQHWLQVSESILKGCEPFGEAKIERDDASGIYTVYAKVAIRGDRFKKLMDEAVTIKTDNLNAEEIKEVVELNRTILDAVKR